MKHSLWKRREAGLLLSGVVHLTARCGGATGEPQCPVSPSCPVLPAERENKVGLSVPETSEASTPPPFFTPDETCR